MSRKEDSRARGRRIGAGGRRTGAEGRRIYEQEGGKGVSEYEKMNRTKRHKGQERNRKRTVGRGNDNRRNVRTMRKNRTRRNRADGGQEQEE